MKKQILALTLLSLAIIFAGAEKVLSAVSPYYGIEISTTTGKASGHISGYWKVANSSSTPTNYTIILDGTDGSVQSSSITATTANITTINSTNISGAFSGNGSAITNITGANISSQVPASVLPSTAAYTSSANTWTADNVFQNAVSVSTDTVLGYGGKIMSYDSAGGANSVGYIHIAPNLTTSLSAFIQFGTGQSSKNLGYIKFQPRGGSGSSSNTIDLGFWGADNLISLTADGNFGINSTAPVSKFEVQGSQGANVTTITATITLDNTHNIVLSNSSGAVTINLPQSSICAGRIYTIKNINTGTVTIDGYNSETIDGSTTYALSSQYDFVRVTNNGSSWFIIGK